MNFDDFIEGSSRRKLDAWLARHIERMKLTIITKKNAGCDVFSWPGRVRQNEDISCGGGRLGDLSAVIGYCQSKRLFVSRTGGYQRIRTAP